MRGNRDRTEAEIAALEAQGRTPAWRFAVDIPGETVIHDYVRGPVTFDHPQIEDFIVVRSDGTVQSVNLTQAENATPKLQACVIQAFKAARFGAFSSPTMTISYPVTFR